jgi:UPF0755 protein
MKFKHILIFSGFSIVVVLFLFFYARLNLSVFTDISFYLDLANPSVRMVRVQEGMRKEEIAQILYQKLNWNIEDKENFINIHLALDSPDLEGRYFPKTYLIHKDEIPAMVGITMFDEFSKQIEKIEQSKPKQIINQDTALKIASIIQREAGGKSDMRLISGIIWNRIFDGMKLQIDATLQYAKGNEEEGWWKKVKKEDKYIDSSYNTYLHQGLPPSPIANPGVDAIAAAYNPKETNCIFYLHDRNRNIHCTRTYEAHKKNIEIYY